MNQSPPPSIHRNPQTQERHRREVFWQITLPLIVGGSVLFGLMVLVILSDAGYVSRWGDIALIWLLPCPMFAALIVAAMFGGMVYGMWQLLRWLPPFALKVQNLFRSLQMKTKTVADGLVEPVLRLRTFFAGAGALKRELSRSRETAAKGNES